MVKLGVPKTVEVEAKTLSLCCKVRDMFTADLKDQDGRGVAKYEGYVPGFMPGTHYGDYLMLEIDIDTGEITNWKTPSAEQLKELFPQEEEEQ